MRAGFRSADGLRGFAQFGPGSCGRGKLAPHGPPLPPVARAGIVRDGSLPVSRARLPKSAAGMRARMKAVAMMPQLSKMLTTLGKQAEFWRGPRPIRNAEVEGSTPFRSTFDAASIVSGPFFLYQQMT